MEPSWAEQRAQPCWYQEHPDTGSSDGKWARTQLLHSHSRQLPPAPLTEPAGLGGFSFLSQISFQLARSVFGRHGEL